MPQKVLLIVIDQFRADLLHGLSSSGADHAMGSLWNSDVESGGPGALPNLRALMQESTAFTQHYTVTTPCGPSRASLLTGLYAMNHRSVRNGTPLGAHHSTLGDYVRTVGIEPLLYGYTDASADPQGKHPNDPDLKNYEGLASGFSEMLRMRLESPGPWVGYLKNKAYQLPENDWDLYTPELDSATATDEYPEGSPIRSAARYRAADSDTAFLTDRVLEGLASFENTSWLSLVTYIRPHPPLVAPAPYNTMVSDQDLRMPHADLDIEKLSQSHPFFDAYFSEPSNGGLFSGFDGNHHTLSAASVQALRAVYAGLAIEVDHHIGRIVDYLKQSGQYDETLLIVTADHGEMLGDQHVWGKNFPFDAALRIPLLIRDPRAHEGHGSVVGAMTESVDIVPTILDWVGASQAPALDGRSLCPWLQGRQPENWRREIFAEAEMGEPDEPTRFERALNLPLEKCNYAVLRDGKFKYVHFNGGLAPMLFDVESDPLERQNLAEDARYSQLLIQFSARMLDHRMTCASHALSAHKLTGKGLYSPSK